MSRNPFSTSTPDYTMGYSEEYVRFLSHRSEESLAYLIPYLKPGLRVLDVGCGPGVLSLWLAEAVDGIELHGIDVEPSQVETAEQLALMRRREDLSFQIADISELPFEDGFFDVAFCNDVLAYVPDTGTAIGEVKRVLKPGGVFGCREMIIDSCFLYPELGFMKRGFEVFADLLAADEGYPQMGKELKMRLQETGLTDIQISASFEVYDSPERVEIFHRMVKEWFLSSEVTVAANKYGASTERLFGGISKAVDEWKGLPDAWGVLAFGEGVGTRP